VILGAGGLPDQTATHLVLAIPDHDDFIVATLRQAAAQVLAQGAAPAAAAYLRRALAEPPRPEERARVLYELGVAELRSGAAESARHLRQAVDELEDATSSPEIVLAYSHAMEVAGQISPATLDLLRRTSVHIREVDVDLHWRIEGQMIIAAHFDPELYPLVADQLATPPDEHPLPRHQFPLPPHVCRRGRRRRPRLRGCDRAGADAWRRADARDLVLV
jgi:hypothetical protein